MPLFYYLGYSINLKTNEIKTVSAEKVDGLISFDILAGNYEITINYKGTTLRKTSIILNVTCSSVVVGYIIFNFVSKKIKRKSVLNNKVATSA